MDLRSAHVVGNSFIQEYYKIQGVSSLCRFYGNDSKLGRPDANGGMVSLTTEEAMRQNILSAWGEMQVEIQTGDCHDSHNQGYLVVVRGFMIGADRVKRRFTQTFFLAPLDQQKSEFYIRNDIFRYEGTDFQQSYHGQEIPPSEKVVTREDAHAYLVNGDVSVAVDELPVTPVKEVLRAVPILPTAQPIAPPSLAKGPKETTDSFVVPEKSQTIPPPSNPPAQAKPPAQTKPPAQAHPPAQAKPQAQTKPQAQPNPQAQAHVPAPSAAHVINSNAVANNYQDADGRSIILRNLSLYVTRKQLQDIFKEFGEIKLSNIQLKPNNAYGTSQAFLEFGDRNAANNALQALWNFPLWIDGREIFASRKRSNGQRGGGGGGGGVSGRGGSVSWRSLKGDGRVLDNSNGRNRDFNRSSYRQEGSSDRRSAVKVDHSISNGAYNGSSDRGVSSDRKADVKVDNSNSNGFNNGGASSDQRGAERVGYSNGGTRNPRTSNLPKPSS